MPVHPLCLSEKHGCDCGKSHKERDTSVTALPRSMSAEGAARSPGEEKESDLSETVASRRASPVINSGSVVRLVSPALSAERRNPGEKETRRDD